MIQNLHFRYLPVSALQRQWGLFLVDCGHTRIRMNEPYPPSGHPARYDFKWEAGRILEDYHLVYITQGKGFFETRETGSQSLQSGEVLLLFPGVWHRYKPDPATGWEEQWIGFNGTYAKQLMKEPFFSPKTPILSVGVDEVLRQHFTSLYEEIDRSPTHLPFTGGARVLELLAGLQERMRNIGTNKALSLILSEIQNRLLRNHSRAFDFKKLAAEYGVSYMTLRRHFKQQTGLSPAQYQMNIRIHQAESLLCSTERPITQIASECGFSSLFYFSRLFKKKTGVSPCRYRAEKQDRKRNAIRRSMF